MYNLVKVLSAVFLVFNASNVVADAHPTESTLVQFMYLGENTDNSACSDASDFTANILKNGENISVLTDYGKVLFTNRKTNDNQFFYTNNGHKERSGGYSYTLRTVEVPGHNSTNIEHGILKEQVVIRGIVDCVNVWAIIPPAAHS